VKNIIPFAQWGEGKGGVPYKMRGMFHLSLKKVKKAVLVPLWVSQIFENQQNF